MLNFNMLKHGPVPHVLSVTVMAGSSVRPENAKPKTILVKLLTSGWSFIDFEIFLNAVMGISPVSAEETQ